MIGATGIYPCPACGTAANLDIGCPGCGRHPDPDAAEVIRLDGEIAMLGARVEQSRQAYLGLAAQLGQLRAHRESLAARVSASVVPPPRRPAAGPVPPPAPGTATPPVRVASARPETSARTVQNLLFVLGGLLLGTAAIVFTAVAWATFGLAGRAAILAGLTALALAVPPLVARRGLVATAETIAAVGLLLLVLDGYAAWSAGLFATADWVGLHYAALVCAASAAFSVGYAVLTRLAAPRFAALLAVQPVLPLLAGAAHPGATGWAWVFTALAALDLAAVWLLRGGARAARALRVTAWVGHGVALAVATVTALWSLVVAEVRPVALAGVPLLAAVLVFCAGAASSRTAGLRAAAAGAVVPALAVAALRPVLALRPTLLLGCAALAVLLLAAMVAGVGSRVPAAVRSGLRVGGFVSVGVTAQVTAVLALVVAGTTVVASMPPWNARLAGRPVPFDWQLPLAVALIGAALAVLLPRAHRHLVAVPAGDLAVLALPAAAPVPWWAVTAMDLLAGVLTLLAAVAPSWSALARLGRSWSAPGGAGPSRLGTGSRLVTAGAGGLLVGHGVLVSLARPVSAAGALGAVVVAGLLLGALARRADRLRVAIGGNALALGLLAWPATVAVSLFAVGVAPWWQTRGALVAAGLLFAALVAVRRAWPAYLPYVSVAMAGSVLLASLAAQAGETEASAVYASVGVLLLVSAWAMVPARQASAVVVLVGAGLLLVRAVVALLPAVLAVLVEPYTWLGAIWSGPPAGVGLGPGPAPEISAAAAVGLVVLVLAAAAGAYARRGPRLAAQVAAPPAAVALLLVLAAANAPWPVVPGAALATGLAGLLAVALAPPARQPLPLAVLPLGVALAASGLAGALAAKPATITALGVVVVAAAAAGVAGRTPAARVIGWLVSAVAGQALAVAASLAGGLPLPVAAFPVLAAAAAAVGVGAALRLRRPAESVPVEAAGHAAAAVALLLAWGQATHAAAICTMWGVVMGVRALRPGEAPRRRWALTVAAAGCELLASWLLLAARQVTLVEAYTLPASAVALVVGWFALRARLQVTSWLAYGPGLCAALLPSLASVFAAGGQLERRLLLGVGALVVVLAGAVRRRQAPVLIGGATLVLLALREIVGLWELLPRWIYLGAGGLVLIALAATYERRRRDLARLRTTIARMT